MGTAILTSNTVIRKVLFIIKFYILVSCVVLIYFGIDLGYSLTDYYAKKHLTIIQEKPFYDIYLPIVLAIISFCLSVCFIIFYAIWLYKFHANIKTIKENYPISKNGALVRIFIPIYNLWGFFKIHITFIRFIKRNYIKAHQISMKLKTYLLIIYLLAFILYSFSLIGSYILQGKDHLDELIGQDILNILLLIILIFWFIINFRIIQLMKRGLVFINEN